MSHLVLYYSRTGSNEFLAKRIAGALGADIEEVRPLLNFFPGLLLSTATGFGSCSRRLKSRVEDYDSVVFCGPLWAGKVASPLQRLVRKFRKRMKRIFFVTCCASTDEKKDERFGYAGAFRHVEKLAGGVCAGCEAFPMELVIPEELQGNDDAFMKTRLSEENFQGKILERFDRFINGVSKI